jgi:L-ascorbate metabolism protein UlaG (beta-lactamase superfamily)
VTRFIGWVVVLSGCSSAGGDRAPDARTIDGPPAIVVDAPAITPPLQVHSLGVQGFALQVGDEVVLTAPMFTRQSTLGVTLGIPLAADTAAIADGLAGIPLAQVRAVVSGHAHYDHLLDVPQILAAAPSAHVFTNRSGQHMLAALAPDRPGCTNAQPTPVIARDRVIAMDAALASRVDYTNCPALRPPGAPVQGTWVTAPGGRVRVMAVCSAHPDQIGPIHFGEGAIDADQCELPQGASGWLEGMTLAFLIDFLDAGGEPVYRVFYQDAPADGSIGEVPAAVLGDIPVDLALLCVGSYAAVENQPTGILANLGPRFAVSGHWEDFFVPRDQPPQPLPLLDLGTYVTRAETALAAPADAPLTVDGVEMPRRHVVAQPGMKLTIRSRR